MSRNKALALSLLLLAGCDRLSPNGREERSGNVAVRIADNQMANASEAPVGVGSPMAWRVEGGQALYEAAGQDPVFAIRCDRAQNAVILDRSGGGTDFGLQVGGETVALDSHPAANGRVQARVPLDNPALERMAAPQAALTLTGGAQPVAVPGGVAIRRIVDACRTPPAPPAPAATPGAEVSPPVIGAPVNGVAPVPAPSPSPTAAPKPF